MNKIQMLLQKWCHPIMQAVSCIVSFSNARKDRRESFSRYVFHENFTFKLLINHTMYKEKLLTLPIYFKYRGPTYQHAKEDVVVFYLSLTKFFVKIVSAFLQLHTLQICTVFNCVPLSTLISLYGLHLTAIYSPM